MTKNSKMLFKRFKQSCDTKKIAAYLLQFNAPLVSFTIRLTIEQPEINQK
jgi:hypothetical protein